MVIPASGAGAGTAGWDCPRSGLVCQECVLVVGVCGAGVVVEGVVVMVMGPVWALLLNLLIGIIQ